VADQHIRQPSEQYPPPGYGSTFKTHSGQDMHWGLASKHVQVADPINSILRPYRDPIIINSTLQSPDALIKIQQGLHGTAVDILQHLHTNLRVGRTDRVKAILQRLAEQSPPNAPELIHAHVAFLEESLRILASYGTGTEQALEAWKEMESWFELEVIGKGVRPDAKLLVIMIRAAARGIEDPQRELSIRRLAHMAEEQGPEVFEAVLDSEDYDDYEYTVVGRAASEFFDVSEDMPEDMPEEDLLEPSEPMEEPTPASQAVVRQDYLDLNDLPEVLATEQKGSGLSGVKRAMEAFISLPPLPNDAPPEAQYERALERQKLLEETSVDIAMDRWKQADEDLRKLGIHTSMQSKPLAALMWQWYQTLLPKLQAELAEVKQLFKEPIPIGKETDRLHYGPFMELLPLETMAADTIVFAMTKIARGKDWNTRLYERDSTLVSMTKGLGNVLEAEAQVAHSVRTASGKKQAKTRETKRRRQAVLRKRKQRDDSKALSTEEETNMPSRNEVEDTHWPMGPKIKLAAMLIEKLLESAQLPVTREHPRTKEKVTQLQAAFSHRVQYLGGKKVGMVTPNDALIDKLEHEPVGSLIAKRMPMVVPPKPWAGWSEGGYLHYPNPILRLPNGGDKSGKDYFEAADTNGDMSQVYAGLNALSQVPWKIHHDVFKVQLAAWNSGEAIANFAPINPRFDLPPEPAAASDLNARRTWLGHIREIEGKRSGLHSKRCFQNFQLEIARAVVNETLYFPHNLDFRGRAYPIPPYLNHMGADNVRALLVFAEGKPLGPDGLRWLKIHLATVAGHDKASMADRVQFTTDHLDDIYDSCRNPLDGRRWWLQAEDAWQTLAACYELTQALDSPDPEKFMSHIPVQQDGTCNGLQHYAALGGDTVGARQVNLEPGDKPADVYTAVADAVKEEVRKDAEQGHAIAQKLHGRITRKCVKQPVMTNVYGVTFFGAREQVRRQLEVLFPEVGGLGPEGLHKMAHYVTTKIFSCLGTMFGGAQAIQRWLGICADRVATCLSPEQVKKLVDAEQAALANVPDVVKKPKRRKAKQDEKQEEEQEARPKGRGKAKPRQEASAEEKNAEVRLSSSGSYRSDIRLSNSSKPMFKSTVVWTTPLRLPVVQPYRTTKSQKITTNMQGVYLQQPQVWDPVSKRKQLQAFPPNFIHSLDATHMLLSALKCTEFGMTFASIHDSFWTHASDVDSLSQLLRDAFVEMHSDDIIGRLRTEFQVRYKGCLHLASVTAHSAAGQVIIQHRRAEKVTRANKLSELAVEAERLRLIDSEDPAEREQGEAMVTPGSLLASCNDESAIANPRELAGHTLGDMPDRYETEELGSDVDAFADIDDSEAKSMVEDGDSNMDDLEGDDSAGSTEARAAAGDDSAQSAEDPTTEEGDATAPEPHGLVKKKKQRYASANRKVYVWTPVRFPEKPPKGSFDVTRLRASRYFFH